MLPDAAGDSLIAMLVEDSLADAELIAIRLAPAGDVPNSGQVRIIHVTTAAAAIATLRTSAVKIIILDLSLPDARGLEALHRIRHIAPYVPIIVLTGAYDEAAALEALRAGAQDYVLKPPPDAQSLHRILNYALQRQQLLQELDAAVKTSTTVARRWRVLAEVGTVLAESTNRETAMLEVAKRLVPTAADCAVIFLASDAQALALLEVAHAEESCTAEVRGQLRELLFAPGADVAFEAASDSSPMSSIGRAAALQIVISSLGATRGTTLPLHFGGRLRGFLLMVASSDRDDAAVDDEFVRSVADRIALALEQGYLIRQAQLLAAARDRAVGIVSHDIGNSLNTIQICAEALLDPDPPPESGVRNMAEMIQRAVTWMRRIAGDLHDRTSLDTGLLTLDRHPTNVPELMRSAHAMFAPAAEERAMELVIEHAADLPPVDADPDRLMQVLSNLLGNAIKFTPPGGRVVLSTQRAEADVGVRFTVSDTGPGIRSEDLEHVFDWFWHAPPPRRGGKGLGLAIAKELVEAHRQSLHVESTLGQGSTFWFTMPAAAEHTTRDTIG
jgi:signal transduction histidine kinase/CheY-like chemotaxis protein